MNPRLLASLALGGAAFLAGSLATGAEPAKPRPTAAISQSGMGGTAQPSGEPLQVGRDGKREFAPRGSDCGVPGVSSYLVSLGSPRFVPFKRTTKVTIPDTVQLVFLARITPVRIELKVQGKGMSLNERWEANLRKLFAAFDRDGDGFLNRHEAERIFSKHEFRQVVQGGYAFRGQGALPTLEALDRDGDSRVSFEELADYYETEVNAILKMRVTAVPNYNQQSDQITPELFARFDTNEDGKLSEAELKNAERIILPLDANEDECVSAAEILATPFRKQIVAVPGVGAGMAMNAMPGMAGPNGQAAAAAAAEFQAHLETLPGSIVQQLIKKYDKDGDFLLTREEIGFSPEKFARLDLNKDGKLSATELDAWRNGPPDLTLTLSLGPTPTEATIRATPEKGTREITVAVEENRTILLVGTQPIDIAPFSIPVGAQQQQRNPYAYVFPQGKNVVTEDDLAGPQNQFLRVLFEPADFNGDGKLTREEFDNYFAIQRQTGELGLSLSHATRMPNFFQLLDQNGDGKLSARELRTAYRRIIALEPTGGKDVTRAILQPSVLMRVGPTQVAAYDPSLFNNQGMNVVTDTVPSKGPLWFRKMDRNGDGDVSRIEFLGTKEQFDAIDTNKDGLITLQEAEAFDKRRPEKK